MRFFLTAFLIELKRQFCSLRVWAILLLLPLLTFALQYYIPDETLTAPVEAAFVSEDSAGDALYELLRENPDSVVVFTKVTQEEAENKVAAGLFDCAFVCGADFGKRLAEGETEKLIRVIVSDNSVVYPVVEEAVASAVIRLSAPMEARRYLTEKKIIDEKTADAEEERLTAVLADEERVHVLVRNISGEDLPVADAARNALRRLLILPTLLILPVWLIFAAADSAAYLRSPFGKRLSSVRGTFPAAAAVTMARIIPLALSLVAAIRLW